MDGDAISLVIVDNGQIYIGDEGAGSAEASAMGEVVRWLNGSDGSISARRKLLVLTSSILVGENCTWSLSACFQTQISLQSPSSGVSLTSIDAAFSGLSHFFSNGLGNISVDASCDLVSALRHMAPPATNVIEYKRGSEVSDLELAIREFIPQSHIKLSLQG